MKRKNLTILIMNRFVNNVILCDTFATLLLTNLSTQMFVKEKTFIAKHLKHLKVI